MLPCTLVDIYQGHIFHELMNILGPKHICFEQPCQVPVCHWDIFWDKVWAKIWVLKVLIALSSLGGRRPLTGAV